jgi:RNase P/RNase MRP subunit p29
VVLPKLQMLHATLPLETHLPSMFGMKGKVITETENTIKQVLKNLSINELVVYGTPQNRNPLIK